MIVFRFFHYFSIVVCVCACLRMFLCKHTCFYVLEWTMNCLSEAVKRGSEMRARQFEVGNERCPFSFERHRGLSLSDATSSYMSTCPLCCSLPLLCLSLSTLRKERAKKEECGNTTVSHSDLEIKYQPRSMKRR